MKQSIIITGTILVLMAMLISIPGAVGASDHKLDIIDTDTSAKTLEAGETASYRWTLTNSDNHTYRIIVIIPETSEKWTVEVVGSSEFDLPSDGSIIVEVTASPITDDAEKKIHITVLFHVETDNGSSNTHSTVVAEMETEVLIFGLLKNPLPAPMDNQAGDFLLSLVLWIILIVFITIFIRVIVKRITGKTKIKVDDIILKAVRVPLIVVLILYGIISSLKLLSLEENTIHWLELFYEIVVIILLMQISIRILSALVAAGIRTFSRLNEPSVSNMLLPMTRKIGIGVILVVGVFTILDAVGLNITFFVTSMGVVGIIVAFAAQDSLSNIFAGFHLMLDQSFKIGDRILLPQRPGRLYSAWGDVLHIGLRSTKVRSTDGIILTIPNKLITENSLTNFGHIHDPSLRVRIRFGVVPTWSNVQKAREILMELANAHPDVQEKPRLPQVVLREFGDYDLIIELRFYVESPKKMRGTKSALIEGILQRFEEESVYMSTPALVNLNGNVDLRTVGFEGLKAKGGLRKNGEK